MNSILYNQMGKSCRRGLDNQGYILPTLVNTKDIVKSKEVVTNVQKHQPINLVEKLYMNRFHSTYYDNYTKKEIEKNYISLNNRNKDTEENVTSYLTQKKWLQRIGFNDNLFTNMITEMNVDRVFLLSCLISKGYVHQLCNPQLENRLKLNNIIIILAYMIDPGLTEIQLNDDEVGWGDEDEIIEDNKLPELPDSIQKFVKRINKTTESFENHL